MPLIPALPPQAVPVRSGFDYVTVDVQRRRVYAAHTGSRSLTVVDADSGKVNGVLAAYDGSGTLVGATVMPAHVDQCDLDREAHEIACAAGGTITLLRDNPAAAPSVVAQIVTGKDIHTLAIDPATQRIWAAWAEPTGDFVQAYKLAP